MLNITNPIFNDWPELSFKEIENIKIEDPTARIFYKTFFTFVDLPENLIRAFYEVLKEENY